MVEGNPASEQKAQVILDGGSTLESLPAPLESNLIKALDSYFSIQDALANDSTDDVSASARSLAADIGEMQKIPIPDDPDFWGQLADPLAVIVRESAAVATASDIAASRLAFGNLSVAFRKLVGATGIPLGYPQAVQAMHCPMFSEDQGGAVWLQIGDEVRNPYMGSAMLGCFDDRKVIPVTGGAEK